MEKNTGKVREKSGNFVSPEKWEPCHRMTKEQFIGPCHLPKFLGKKPKANE